MSPSNMSPVNTSSTPLLAVRDLSVSYGGIKAVKHLNLELHQGELVSLIGANGAGKTTTLKAICGLLAPQSGEVLFDGRSIKGQGAWTLVSQGLVMVPEGRGIFTRMSIDENLRMGAYLRQDKAQIEADIESVYQRFPRLKERHKQLAGTLSGGEQQMLAMGRALLAKPRLLLLDEPSMGLAPIMVDKIFEVVRDVAQQGVTVLLVEQNAHRALEMADRAYVLDSGEVALSGPARELLGNPQVQAAYLGA
ncbi:ABC transporter ATP-binding protein [Aquabacterium sp. NJ1]|uniref:ABC transporter ATP-binding protein n=1 Tax=Aquabacterium sp. NJ1 TaxID=1538295 RepID=UPI000ACACD53|nr:ABC transporter ATP-binding protein [Aquabacterium sp. NJ1]